jgi:predicted metalloprotease
MTDTQPLSPAAADRVRRPNAFVAAVLAAVLALGLVVLNESSSSAARYDADAESTIADLQSYWSATMPSVYHKDYEAIPADRLYPYSASNPPPGCGTPGRTPYQEVAGNAFYCSEGDFVAWDTEKLLPTLRTKYGDFAPALVLAHEWGHAIQARVGFQADATVYMEQQADCFAGSWASHVAADGHLVESDLDNALVGLLALRDPSGIDGSEDGAHGNGFDRVRAFQDGYEGGASACAAYQDHPPVVTESGYTSYADYASGGDMSTSELVPALTDSLQSYWATNVANGKGAPRIVAVDGAAANACSGSNDGGVLSATAVFCSADDTIYYDRNALELAATTVGDFSAGVVLAAEYSAAVQAHAGQAIGTEPARQTATCLTGAYTASLDPSVRRSRSAALTLSPGDLDEVVATLVHPDASDGGRGTAFSRVAAFRTGFFKGATACTKL